MTISREEQYRKADKHRGIPAAGRPDAAQNAGEETPNPLPDPDACDGDVGRASRVMDEGKRKRRSQTDADQAKQLDWEVRSRKAAQKAEDANVQKMIERSIKDHGV